MLLINEAIKSLVPNAQFTVHSKNTVPYQGERNPLECGDYLITWSVNNTDPCPSVDEILQKMQDSAVLAVQTQLNNDIINQPILDQLAVIDFKSIRALREQDSVRMAQYEAQAATLRSQLVR